MHKRRDLLLSAGALATTSAVGTVGARRDEGLSPKEVNKEFLSGTSEDGVKGAKQALEDLGLDPTVNSKSLGSVKQKKSKDEEQVSSQGMYGKPEDTDSELIVSVSPTDGNDPEIWMSLSMKLKDPKHSIRHSWFCPDAIGFGYIDKDWGPKGTPGVSVTQDHTAKYTTEDVADNALAGTVNLENHYDRYEDSADPEEALPEATASMTSKFELRKDKIPTTIWGTYTHTYSPTGGGGIDKIAGGYKGLDVELNFRAAKAWSIAKPVDPEPHI